MGTGIQEARMKSYFLDAVKEIIRGEGLQAVSARNVAERAGYSYATLYNYYKDMQELLLACVADFKAECIDFVDAQTGGPSVAGDKENDEVVSQIHGRLRAGVLFFVQYPGIFELFFIQKIEPGWYGNGSNDLISGLFNAMVRQELDSLPRETVMVLESLIRNSLAGILLYYVGRRRPPEFSEFLDQLDRLLNSITSFI